MKFSGTPQASLGNPYSINETDPSASLGQVIFADDGAKYVYALNGAVALVRGALCQSAIEDTGDQNIAAVAAAIGATSIVTAAMTVTKNQYAGGYVTVTVTPGLATKYRIKQHEAFTSAAATFLLEDTLQVALTSSSRLDFVANPCNGVLVNPTTATGTVVGVAVNALTAGQYGWLQTWGIAAVTNDAAGAMVVGDAIMPSSSVAGAVRVQVAGKRIVGQMMAGVASGEVGTAFLTIS